MTPFHSICAYGDDAAAVIIDCLKQLEDIPPESNFGFIYVSDELTGSLESLLQKCKFKTGIQNWAGSLGVGIISENTEIYDLPAISMLLCNFPEKTFSVLETVRESADFDSKLKLPENSDFYFALLHVDAYNTESQNLLDELDATAENFFIAGGITSSRDSQLHVANQVASDGISGVIFSDQVPVLTNLSQGCTPLGEKHRVTKSQENVAIRLDDRPALDVLYDDIGEMLSRDLEKASDYIFTGICIENSDISDYKIRTFVGIDEEHKVFGINDYVNEDDRIIFCKRDSGSAREDMQKMLHNMKKRITGPIKGGIYISCLGRGREQFGEHSEEVKMIHETLGDFPLAGFFANGEIHNKHIYGYTGVLTLFV